MKKKAKQTKTPKKIELKKSKETPRQAEEEKPFDFGGIPDRDLKKNLGCG
ncbi:MAG TPA: hypothetical protein VF473_09415 [Cyclobacteriaceae bacterium]